MISSSLNNLSHIPQGVSMRWFTAENFDGARGSGGKAGQGRKGSPLITVEAGQSVSILSLQDVSGTVRRIWATVDRRDPATLRGLRIAMYWDGEEKPALDAPWGDFFGLGLGQLVAYECALFSSPEGRSFNAYVPMPFRSAAQITVTNETDHPVTMFYEVDVTVGETHDPMTGYLHGYWNRQNPTVLGQDFEILPGVGGRGRFLGCHVGERDFSDRYPGTWWGEGEVKMYVDGDQRWPTLCGTGVEDYAGTGWGFEQYAHAFQGCPFNAHEQGLTCFYRYHIPDPVYFEEDIRVTIQQIGCLGPGSCQSLIDAGLNLTSTSGQPIDLERVRDEQQYVLFERQDDYSSMAYFYLDRPASDLPRLAAVAERTADLETVTEFDRRADV